MEGSMEEQFPGKTANASAMHLDLHFAVQGGEHPEATTAPKMNVSKPEQLLFYLGFDSGSFLPHNRLRLKANVFNTWLSGLEGVETMHFSASAWFCRGKSQQD